MNIYINSIRYNNSLVDGPGIRTVLFLQGCDIHCEGCQNSSSWDINKGISIDIETLVDELKNNSFNKKITISGGEPLFQKMELKLLLNELSKFGFDIVLYTAYQKKDVPLEILKKIRYLKTGPYIQKLKTTTMPYIGSTNQTFEEINQNETNNE